MIDRTTWYNNVIFESLLLSKKLLPNLEYRCKLSTIKIRVQFSRRQVRSVILVFWCLFIALGPHFTRKASIQVPLKKVTGLGARQGMFNLELIRQTDVLTFLDL